MTPIVSRVAAYLLPPLVISGLYAALIFVIWTRRVKDRKPINQKVDAYRNPINLGITVSGFVFPLLGAVIGYVVTKEGSNLLYLGGLVASSLLLIGAIGAGLYLAYSFATSTTDETITIDATHNTIVPAVLVFHFALLISALLVSLTAFAIDGERMLQRNATPSASPTVNAGSFDVTRGALPLGSSRAAVERAWGTPARVNVSQKGTILAYYSSTCRYELTFTADRLTTFTQHAAKVTP